MLKPYLLLIFAFNHLDLLIIDSGESLVKLNKFKRCGWRNAYRELKEASRRGDFSWMNNTSASDEVVVNSPSLK